MQFEIKGLVLRETPTGENGSWLDVLTAEAGKISVYARGVRSYKSRNRDATAPLSYSTFVLNRQKPDFILLTEAKGIASYGASTDLNKNALSMYVAEILREFALPDQPDGQLLRLALNTLHAISAGKYPPRHVKPAFELRIMSDEGFAPDIGGCGECGNDETDDVYLDVMNGGLVCGSCLAKRGEGSDKSAVPDDGTAVILLPASRPTRAAMRYIMSSPLERLFAFRLTDPCIAELGVIGEKYLLNHLERSFPTLDFYKQVERLG